MVVVQSLIQDLDELTIAQRVALPFHEAKKRIHMYPTLVQHFEEFRDILADYTSFVFAACISQGGRLSRSDAYGRAKQIIEQEYRRRNGDITTAFNEAHDGTGQGLYGILVIITESLLAEATEHYVRDTFDRHVAPNSWEGRVEIIRQFIAEYGRFLGNSIDRAHPERYARNYEDLIQSYVDAVKQTSTVFRRH